MKGLVQTSTLGIMLYVSLTVSLVTDKCGLCYESNVVMYIRFVVTKLTFIFRYG